MRRQQLVPFLSLLGFIGEFVFGEEVDFAALYPQDVLLQVDTGLVGLEHVETEQEVDVTALNTMFVSNGDSTRDGI